MDGKKKRNRKKKGNQGKNADDAASNAGDVALENQNHEPASQDNHNGMNADDAASSVGDRDVPQDKNRELPPRENHNGTNAMCADVQSIGASESDAELDKHKLYEAKFINLHETIKQLEDEKSSSLQKVGTLETKLEALQNKLDYHVRNEAILEEKLNILQDGYEALVKEEVSLKETVLGLEVANKALQAQVKVLEESSNSMAQENQLLVQSFHELEPRIQILEGRAAFNEASETKELPEENKTIVQMELTGSLLYQQAAGFVEVSMERNELSTERGQSTSAVAMSEGNDDSSNHPEALDEKMSETARKNLSPVEFPEMTSSTHDAVDTIDMNVPPGPKQGLHGPRISEEIVAVPLDDIQIHEAEPTGAASETANETAEAIPLSDAPLIGAPIRLFSFVAKYVSGADLVNQKTLQPPRRAV